MNSSPSMPLVSVIIPTCNGVNRYIDQAIASVLSQTFQDFELIIIDDASTDGTLEYVQDLILKLMPAHQQITYSQREINGGPAVARNDGAKRAKGEFLAFLDQDDLWAPPFLDATVTLLQAMRTDIGAVCTDRYRISADGSIMEMEHGKKISRKAKIRYGDICTALLQGQHSSVIGSFLFRKSAFESAKGFDENLRVCEDRDFFIRFSQHAHVAYLPKPLYSFRRQYGRRSACESTPPKLAFASRKYYLEKHAPSCKGRADLKEALSFEWANLYSDMGKYYLSQHKQKKARQFFLSSLRFRPFSRKTLLRFLRSYVPSF